MIQLAARFVINFATALAASLLIGTMIIYYANKE